MLFDNRYISANMPKTDQVKSLFATTLGEMYPVGQLYCLAGRSPASLWQVLGRTLGIVLGNVRFFFTNVTKHAGFRNKS